MRGVERDVGSCLPDSHVVGMGPEYAKKALFSAGLGDWGRPLALPEAGQHDGGKGNDDVDRSAFTGE